MEERLLAVQRMQDYVQEHIDENITLADLSRASLFSPWYSLRLFREYTGFTPADYIRRMKLSASALRLRDEKTKILDEALELGFQSAEGYQRAFFREFGCNPGEYARNPVPIPLFTSYGVIYNEMRKEHNNMEEIRNVFIRLVHKPERKVIVKRGKSAEEYFTYCEEVGCDVWGLLTSIKSISGEPCCLWLPEKYRLSGTSVYVQGVEVSRDYDGTVPEGFDVILLPEADYMAFQGEPYAEENYCRAIEEVQAAIDRYDPQTAGHAWDPENPRIQLEPIGRRGYIEMVPVKSV